MRPLGDGVQRCPDADLGKAGLRDLQDGRAIALCIRSDFHLALETVVIDTSNSYPHRDGRIEAIENGQPESEWVSQRLGRPIIKAWNAVGSSTFTYRNRPAGHPERIGLPIAGDDVRAKQAAATLVDASGIDSG